MISDAFRIFQKETLTESRFGISFEASVSSTAVDRHSAIEIYERIISFSMRKLDAITYHPY
jgi:hypothetical protein